MNKYSQPPNPNEYSIDGTMRNYSASGLQRYRKAFIAYCEYHGIHKEIVTRIKAMTLDEYAVSRGFMLQGTRRK